MSDLLERKKFISNGVTYHQVFEWSLRLEILCFFGWFWDSYKVTPYKRSKVEFNVPMFHAIYIYIIEHLLQLGN